MWGRPSGNRGLPPPWFHRRPVGESALVVDWLYQWKIAQWSQFVMNVIIKNK